MQRILTKRKEATKLGTCESSGLRDMVTKKDMKEQKPRNAKEIGWFQVFRLTR